MSNIAVTHRPPDEAAIDELEKILSTPLDYLVLKVLELDNYYNLLPWDNRCQVSVVMLTSVHASGKVLIDVHNIE